MRSLTHITVTNLRISDLSGLSSLNFTSNVSSEEIWCDLRLSNRIPVSESWRCIHRVAWHLCGISFEIRWWTDEFRHIYIWPSGFLEYPWNSLRLHFSQIRIWDRLSLLDWYRLHIFFSLIILFSNKGNIVINTSYNLLFFRLSLLASSNFSIMASVTKSWVVISFSAHKASTLLNNSFGSVILRILVSIFSEVVFFSILRLFLPKKIKGRESGPNEIPIINQNCLL